MHLFWIFSI